MDLPRRAASSARQRQPLPFCRRTYLPPSPRCGRRWHSRPQDADVSSFPNSLASFPVWSFGFLNTFSLDRIFSSPKPPHLPSISTETSQWDCHAIGTADLRDFAAYSFGSLVGRPPIRYWLGRHRRPFLFLFLPSLPSTNCEASTSAPSDHLFTTWPEFLLALGFHVRLVTRVFPWAEPCGRRKPPPPT